MQILILTIKIFLLLLQIFKYFQITDIFLSSSVSKQPPDIKDLRHSGWDNKILKKLDPFLQKGSPSLQYTVKVFILKFYLEKWWNQF